MRLDKIKLNNGIEFNPGDFNVFIGGNGVGKTTIIAEIFHRVSGVPKSKYWWINEVSYSTKDMQKDMKLLKNSFARQKDGLNLFYFSNAVKNIGGGVDLDGGIRFSNEEADGVEKLTDPAIFLQRKYSYPFISFSSCETRLSLSDEANASRFDQPPQDPLNVLYRNGILLAEIDRILFEIFQYHFILLSHLGTMIQIGISKDNPPVFDHNATSKQDEFEKVERWKQENFTPITEAGHGIRSMTRLLTSLLEPVNQIIVIDEPEMHLYPSQKRWLGRQLVQLAAKQNKQVFLVTHDPMILQGVLDENTKTNIFRVDRDDSEKGIIKYCEFDKIEATYSRNQEQYLQGLFYQRCVVVEGASDRSFYQQMFEEYSEIQDKDLGVVVAGGVGNSAHMVHLASKVGLKAAFIYDLDVLIDSQSLIKDLFKILGGVDNPIKRFEEHFDSNGSVKTAKDKGRAIRDVTGFEVKSGFSKEWITANEEIFSEALNNLASVGIFVVPNGTLESWAPDVEEKIRFAENAPAMLKSDKTLKTNFDGFAKKVLNYLSIKIL